MEDLPLPPKRQRALSTKWVVVITVVALGIGYGIGQTPSEAKSEPTTTTVTTQVTPQSCLEALDLAAQVFGFSAEAMDAAARGFGAASRFDIAGIDAAGDDISAAGDKITGITPAWQAARDECQGGAA